MSKNKKEDEAPKEKKNISSVKTKKKQEKSTDDIPKNNKAKILFNIIIAIIGCIIIIWNISTIVSVASMIRYGNTPTIVLAILAIIIANPLLYKITKLNKKWYIICIGYIIAIALGITSISLKYSDPWDFDLNKEIEFSNVIFSVPKEWELVNGNDEELTAETYYIYPLDKDNSSLIMFQVSDLEGATNELDNTIINSYVEGMKKSGATIKGRKKSKINGYKCVIIDFYYEGNGVNYLIPYNNKVYSISYGAKGNISKGFKSKAEEIIKTIKIKSVTLEPLYERIEKGDEIGINVKFNPKKFKEDYTLKSSDETIAIIENDKIKGLKNGKVTISVESESGLKDSKEIEVYTNVESVTLDKSELTMHIGDSATLNAVVLPEDSSDITITWNSSDSEVASVDTSGNITAKSLGTTTIKATAGGKTAECKVYVVDLTPEEYKAQCTNYSFEELARNPSSMIGKYVKVTGEVVQVIRGYGNSIALRVNITKWGSYSTYYKDTIYVNYTLPEGGNRILEDDIVTIYGKAAGEKSYTSTLGATITIPEIDAEYIDIN